MRLIDADEFIKDECNSCDGSCESLPCDCLECKADCRCDFIKDLENAPTIDAVQIVRCKDCKHSRKDDVFHTRWCQKPGSIRVVKDEFFCAYGERKDNADS